MIVRTDPAAFRAIWRGRQPDHSRFRIGSKQIAQQRLVLTFAGSRDSVRLVDQNDVERIGSAQVEPLGMDRLDSRHDDRVSPVSTADASRIDADVELWVPALKRGC